MSEEAPNRTGEPSVQDRNLLIQLHTTEYMALTTRATYLIAIMAAVWTLAVIYLGLVGQLASAQKLSRFKLYWGSGIVLQLVVVVWAQLLLEQYRLVLYVEENLKPTARKIIGGDFPFWEYEKFETKERGAFPYWEILPPLGTFAAFVAVLIHLWPLMGIDFGGVIANAGLLAWMTSVVLQAAKARRRWESINARTA